MKKLLLALVSTTILFSCNTVDLQNQNFYQQDQLTSIQSSNKLKTPDLNWYDKLRPDLQQYYARAKGKTGSDLFDALHQIISENNKIISYQDSKSFMYATLDNISQNNKTGIVDAYSQVFIQGNGGNGDTYKEQGDDNKDGVSNDFINCEHTWPQSFFNKDLPMVADLHHLQSTLSVPNNRRSNFPFGMVTGQVLYTNVGGSKLGAVDLTGQNRSREQLIKALGLDKNTNKELMSKNSFTDPSSEGVSAVFEPDTPQKGRTARAMLYFYTRYYDQNIRQGGFDKNSFWVSKVPTFIDWHINASPSNDVDMKRNDVAFKKQGNRNPFIDVPDFALLIGESVFKSK